MSEVQATVDAKEDGGVDFNLTRWMVGYLLFFVLAAGGSAMVSQVLLPQRIKDLGVENPTVVLGSLTAIGSIVALFCNLIVGVLSDLTRSRFGKRTPWLFWGLWFSVALYCVMGWAGAIAAIAAALWCSKLSYNMQLAPVYATLSDRVPESKRGTISSAVGFGITFGIALGTFIGAKFITVPSIGITVGGAVMGIAGILFLVIIPREQSNKDEVWEGQETAGKRIVHAFTPPTKGASDFWKAFICRTLFLLAIQMLAGYWLYICQDYIGLSKDDSGTVIGKIAMLQMVASIVAMIIGPLSDKIGKRKIMVLVAGVIAIIGFAIPWFSPTVAGIYGAVIFVTLAQGIYTAIDQALNVDVLPSKENAGRDLGFINAATTAGQSAGMTITSVIVANSGGSYKLVFPIAIIMIVLSVISVYTIKKVK